MVQKLKVENDFTPCPAVVGDELFPNGIFVFNITTSFVNSIMIMVFH